MKAVIPIDEGVAVVAETFPDAQRGPLAVKPRSIVIAHRLRRTRDADLILVIEAGQTVERGSHAGLLAAGGRYADLYQRQFRDSPDGLSAA